MDSLRTTDDASKTVQKTDNRVSLDDMQAKVRVIEYWHPPHCRHMTVAAVHLKNGFVLIGKAAPADPENFNPDLGRKFAYEDAMRQLWPMEGYLLREKLDAQQNVVFSTDADQPMMPTP